MNQDLELNELMQSIAKKSLELINDLKTQPAQLSMSITRYIDLTRDFQALLSSLLENPEKIWQMSIAYWQDAATLAQEQFNAWLQGRAMPINDKRFNHEAWINNPFFNLLSQHYLLASEHIASLLETLDYGDKHLAKRIQFFSQQYLDALSPTNFLQTNPQLMAETLQSHGKNLLRGLNNLLMDIDVDSSRLVTKMTDMNAFKPGKNIAMTKGRVIFRNDMMELIQYAPATAQVNAIPLLIIPPWINKYYILDLSPNNSLVGWLVGQGISVFIISWRNPDASFAEKDLYDYLNQGPMTAIEMIQKQLNVKQVNALGFCIGGTLLACLLAYYAALKETPIKSATFLASMIDFTDTGDMSVFIDEHQISELEKQMALKGYLDGRLMASTFNSLRANDLIWSFFIKHYLEGKDPVPFDILYWNADATNMPAAMHSQYLRRMYLQNDLVKPGAITLNNIPLDVSKITTPSFFISTIKDHIAPWQTTYTGFQLMQGKKQFVLGGSGHIAGIINPPSAQKYHYHVNKASAETAEQWLANATLKTGSWWPEWCQWLKKQSKKQIDAPDISQLPLKGDMDAPGSYVHQVG